MEIVEQSWSWNKEPNGVGMLKEIEIAGRTCYKSDDKITAMSCFEFVAKMIKSGHHAMIEFAVPPSVKIITDRGVTHEIVRHRIASYAQQSTRFCNVGGSKFDMQVHFIMPVDFELIDADRLTLSMLENHYNSCINERKLTPQQARYFLPNGLMTEINMKCNVREWRHFFKLRTSKAAHPQMRALASDMLEGFRKDIPVIFDDLG